MVTQGEVWLVELDPTVGGEIQKTRPCLIVSPDELNRQVRTVLITPLTSGGRPARFRVNCRFQGRDGRILPEQVRVVDRSRLRRRLGQLDEHELTQTLETLQEMFAP